jgi:competence protein ComEA
MDRIAEWRPVEPAGPDGSVDSGVQEPPAPEPGTAPDRAGGSWRLIGAAIGGLIVAGFTLAGLIALAVVSSTATPAVAIDSHASSSTDQAGGAPAPGATTAADATTGATDVVVDVEGAVDRAGLLRLPQGSRIGDAVAAAGGYSAQVDIDAATATLNLAEILIDGQQIHVPLRGEVAAATPTAAGTSGGPTTGGGLIDVNSATPEQLDTLPGIGPVTAAKIVTARQETPFAAIDDLASRGVVGPSTLEKIRSLITVGR